MTNPVYIELLKVMKKRGGDFAGMDIPEFFAMAEELFTPAEAEVNNAMPKGPFSAADLAKSMGRPVEEIEPILEAMADKGLCMAVNKNGTVFYQSARLMPGIFEFQFMSGGTSERDKRIAAVIHAYKKACNQNSDISKPEFPTKRVITVDRAIAANNQVHTYDQVQTYIDKHDQIALTTCYCRHAASLLGEDTHGMPNDVCMQFGMGAQFAVERLNARKITKAEAREVIDRAEDAGLIHMSMNMTDDVGFICNCDRWHCVVVTHALAKNKPGLALNSGSEPRFDAETCVACETGIERCPAEALEMGTEEVPVVNLDRCFGCAVCATGCPSEAITMNTRTDIPVPPENAKAMKEAIKSNAAANATI